MNERKEENYINLILKILLKTEMMTTNQLAEESGLSEKTVRLKINSINRMLLDNHFGRIEKKPRVGIWLKATDEQRKKLMEFLQSDDGLENLNTESQRINSVMKQILKITNKNVLTTKQISDSLFLSIPTTLKIINKCKKWLKLFNIDLTIQRNRGLILIYSEISYRLAVKSFINIFDNCGSIDEKIQYLMPYLQIDIVKNNIINTEAEWGFKFTEDSFNEILIYTCLAVYRNQLGYNHKIYISSDEMKMLQQYNEFSFAAAVYKKMEDRFSMEISIEEIAFLSIQILCSKQMNNGFNLDTSEILKTYDNKLRDFVRKIIVVVSEILDADLTKDKQLNNGLLNHLRPMMFRLRYNRTHTDGITNFVKNEYTNTFRIGWLVSMLFEEYFDLKVNENELSFIVLYIQSAFERNKSPLKAILVTRSGMGINQMLVDKIKRSFFEIQDINLISYHDFDIRKAINYDLILTTKAIPYRDRRIIEVDSFLSDVSIQNINKKINILQQEVARNQTKFSLICHQMFEPDLIFTHLKINSKEELLRFMCGNLAEKGYVTKKYVNTVLEREAYTPTSIGNGVAIPHGQQNEVNEMKVVIATLNHPIKWDSEDVDVIFLLVVKMTTDFEIAKTQTFYKEYVNLIYTDERVDILRKFKDSISFYKYLVN